MGRTATGFTQMEALTILARIAKLREEDSNRLSALFEEVHAEKGQNIIEAGKRSRFIYFIRSGSFRIFYQKEEREIILDFAFPGNALIQLNSYVHGEIGYETIQAMEASDLYKVEVVALQALFADSVGIANWGRRLAEIETLKIEYRLMSKLFKTAKESYEELLDRAPNLVSSIKLGFIASYLGISQVTLSRIRAKI